VICNNRNKSKEMLFESLESDIIDKEKYVLSQTKLINDMQTNINKQVDLVHVLTYVARQSNSLAQL
jgi:hypothetical protein